jgi:phosphoribosylglycinamide formyltransferase 1
MKIAVLISGRGSNMQALIDAADKTYEIALVISNIETAAGLDYAKSKGIKTAFISHKGRDKATFEAEISAHLEGMDFICLAGFMRLLSPEFTQKYKGRLINIHPSLLPAFKGLDTHKRALEAGANQHGATVHYVSAEMDEGEIIMQSSLEVSPHDTETTLAARVLKLEHELYPKALKKLIFHTKH